MEAIRKVKRKKVAEIDNIPGELIKDGGMSLAAAVHDLIYKV